MYPSIDMCVQIQVVKVNSWWKKKDLSTAQIPEKCILKVKRHLWFASHLCNKQTCSQMYAQFSFSVLISSGLTVFFTMLVEVWLAGTVLCSLSPVALFTLHRIAQRHSCLQILLPLLFVNLPPRCYLISVQGHRTHQVGSCRLARGWTCLRWR